jgi:acyl-CoA synthetase (NDP forming)
LRQVRKSKARIYPVNPKESKIEGLQCYRSISEIGEEIDLAIISLPAQHVLETIKKCAHADVGNAVIIAGGFKETGEQGEKIEKQILEVKGKMRILGPNTLGIYFPRNKIDTVFLPVERMQRPKEGSIAFISQSGAAAATLMDRLALYGIGVSAFVGLGNKLDIDENECIDYFANDQKTKAICIYLESFSDPKVFVERCKKISRKKPIVVIKAGRTERGKKAASLHTGSLAGSDLVVDGALKQSGVIRAQTPNELINLGRALAYTIPPKGRRVAIVGNAGGFCVTCCDLIESHGILKIANLSPETKSNLKEVVLPFASVENPVDLTASSVDKMYKDAIEILVESKEVDCILCGTSPQPPGLTEKLPEVIGKYAKRIPIIAYLVGGREVINRIKSFEKLGVAAYPEPESAVKALEVAWQWAKNRKIE